MLRPVKTLAVGLLFSLVLVACAPSAAPAPAAQPQAPAARQPAPQPPAAPPNPVDTVEITKPVEITFYHQLAGPHEELQNKLIAEFMAANSNIKVKAEYLENYTKIHQKVLATIQAGSPPDLVHGYESMASEYYDAKASVPFDDYIGSKKYGLSETDLKDYIPAYLEATRFPQFDNKRLTFPYTKSALTWYTNMEVLKSLGFDKPAATWDEVLTHCRKAVSSGKQCWPYSVDTSGVAGMVFSFGGEVASKDGKKPLYDSPEAMKALKLIETLTKERLVYRISSRDDQNDFVAGKALYYMRSSTGLPFLRDLMKDKTRWSAGLIPQGTPNQKATTLYGGNVIMMKTTPEKQLAAWLFLKHFGSKDATYRWGVDPGTGYFPLRLSALLEPGAKKVIEEYPQYAAVIEATKYGKVEPSAKGWQEMRPIIDDAVVGILTGKLTAEQASAQIQEKGAKALSGM